MPKNKIDAIKVLELDKEILRLFVSNKIEFIFKGGTSLHLKYPDLMQRVSQDIDIAIDKEKSNETIDAIKSLLKSTKGFEIEREYLHEYGLALDIRYTNPINATIVSTFIDISSYINFKQLISFSSDLNINERFDVKFFDPHITFIEKSLSLDSYFSMFIKNNEKPDEFINNELPSEPVRKMRHILDLCALVEYNIVDFAKLDSLTIAQMLNVALLNETKERYHAYISLNSLDCFRDGHIEKIKNVYEYWTGDSYHGSQTKPSFNEMKTMYLKVIEQSKKVVRKEQR